ncbi:MAG: hypothetical protein J7L37_07970, partial [Thermococcus sp.]|nr:hypothetical protein [Thermococcus sp.]
SWKYGAERIEKKYRQILVRKGQKDGEAHYAITPVKEIDRHLALGSKATIVQLPSFDEFIEKHGDYLKLMLLEEILSKSPERISKDEEKKIERTIEIAIDAAKKLAEVYGDPEKLVHVGLMEISHAKDALSILEFLNPEKSPLEVIGDHIIELKKMHPEVVKPEKVYGKEWYEFLKKKGIDPSELDPKKKKSKTTASSQSLTLAAHELLGLLSGLRLAGYSEGALENFRRELEKRIDGLIENPKENFELIGLYTTILKLTERGETEKAERLLKEL